MRRWITFLAIGAVSFCLEAHAEPQGLEPIPKTPELPPMTGFPGLTQKQAEAIAAHAKKVQECMQTTAKEAVKNVQKKSEANGKELRALCKAGKNKEARALAVQQAVDMAASEDMSIITGCTQNFSDLEAALPYAKNDTPRKMQREDPEKTIPQDICH